MIKEYDFLVKITTLANSYSKRYPIKMWMVFRILDALQRYSEELQHKREHTSACHQAPVKIGGKGATHYYICTKCKKACNPFEVEQGN